MLGQIKMATHNLFTLMYKHLQRRVPAQEAGQTLLQLDKVKQKNLDHFLVHCMFIVFYRFKIS